MNILYLVIPCYNEEEVLPETAKRLKIVMDNLIEKQKVSIDSRVIFIDDGSKDKTWEIISNYNNQDELFGGIKLSRNKGHQSALLAGLMYAKDCSDMAISLDADLQDDVDAIEKMVDFYLDGCDVVYGVRSSRTTDTVFKRTTANGFYKFMKLLGVDIVDNHADYRLMSKRAIQALSEFKEVNLFLRGVVPLIGFKSAIVTYERNERFAGESKYPLKKMLAFAFDGITSFSVKPIRFITFLGFIIFACSIIAQIYFLFLKLTGSTVQGWSTLIGSIWMMGGIQLLSIGIIGEYIGKIYKEVKARPMYIVDKILNKEK
ncbi:MAG: glycosyltransferase family 2 protein [Oscillospiraceae bacterium]